MKLLLLIFLFGVFDCLSVEVDINKLSSEISNRMKRVKEFDFLKKSMKDIGINNAYLFGGTAAAWAHYVREDLERELHPKKYPESHYDYTFESIYRSNQDFDFIIDGTDEQAKLLEDKLSEVFDYNIANKTKKIWEVTLLRESDGERRSLLDDKDFFKQHSDSNSLGLINLGDCDNCIKDLNGLDRKESKFLQDVAKSQITFLYSKDHLYTKRYLLGKNPEIFSIIRLYSKIFQYNLSLASKNNNFIESIIQNFNPRADINHDYAKLWLEKDGIKIIKNANNLEQAESLLEDIGLKEKLINIRRNNEEVGSLAWWLSKKSLSSMPLGKSGNMAKDVLKEFLNEKGEIIISHEVDSYSSFESITKSKIEYPNVFESRESFAGEAAAAGRGFYLKLGASGDRATGITISFKLEPNAIEGKDFIYIEKHKHIVLLNKKAATIIRESIQLSPVNFFKKLSSGSNYTFRDKGIIERYRRRFLKDISISDKELNEIHSLIKVNVEKNKINESLIREWLRLKGSSSYPETLDLILNKSNLEFKLEIIEDVLTKKNWHQHDYLITDLLNEGNDEINSVIARYILPLEFSKSFPGWLRSLSLNSSDDVKINLLLYALPQDHWSKYAMLINTFLEESDINFKLFVVNHLLKDNFWSKKPKLIYKLINDESLLVRLNLIEKLQDWDLYPNLVKSLSLDNDPQIRLSLIENVLSKKVSSDYIDILKVMSQTRDQSIKVKILELILSDPSWGSDIDLLKNTVKSLDVKYKALVKKYVLQKSHWVESVELRAILDEKDYNLFNILNIGGENFCSDYISSN